MTGLTGGAPMKSPGKPSLRRVDDQFGAHVVGHRPADDRPREGVLDGGEVAVDAAELAAELAGESPDL
jgi:hypothetical protein